MGSSTIVGVKKALKSMLSADVTLHGVPVFYGVPTSNVPDIQVVIGDVEGEQEARGIDRSKQPRQETYTVTILVSVMMTTPDQSTADERTVAIVAAIEDALRADVTLSADYSGPGQIVWAQFGGIRSLQQLITDDGVRRESRATCAVNVTARI